MRILARLDLILLAQRGHLFPWVPVFFACGIALYFGVKHEPDWPDYVLAVVMAFAAACLAMRRPGGATALAWAVCFVAVGFSAAGLRAHLVSGPVMGWRYYGPVEGRIVGIDRSASDVTRLRLDQVVLERVTPSRTPDQVRISLHGDDPGFAPRPGLRVMTTGHLSPPGGPVEPGGFDFQRLAWFQGLGAVGYTRTPVLLAAPMPDRGGSLWVLSTRMRIAARVKDQLSGDTGGFAAAVTTGDRSGVSQVALEWLRASNTAHLLAISGLHMGLLAGFVFAALRYGMALIPYVALRLHTRKWAAAGALAAATAYLALSGGNVATERAYVMAGVMLVAVMLDRRALSLRSVGIAALIVLALRPEALLGPGFQMSFAATTALVASYSAMADRDWSLPGPGWIRAVLGVVLSSLVAGLATAPVGAAHFNAVAHYGLLANVLSVPVMGTIVVPAAVVTACLAPFGLEWIGLWIMGLGIDWILMIARVVAELEGARSFVPSPHSAVLPLVAGGGLVVALWHGRARWMGTIPMIAALGLWALSDRPPVLIAEGGRLVGVLTDQGRALSKERGAGFVARVWLENDGERVSQRAAAARWQDWGAGVARARLEGREVIHLTTKRAAAGFGECAAGQIIVAATPVSLSGPCQVYDAERLKDLGSLALHQGRIVSSRAISGDRLWNTRRRPDRKVRTAARR